MLLSKAALEAVVQPQAMSLPWDKDAIYWACPVHGAWAFIVRRMCIWTLALPLPSNNPGRLPEFSELLMDNKANLAGILQGATINSDLQRKSYIDSLLGFHWLMQYEI